MSRTRDPHRSHACPHDSAVARGRAFEAMAVAYLEQAGMTVLDRNYRAGPRELDIVALDGATLVFVEVKGRTRAGFGHPFDAISPGKRREVEEAARGWWRARGRQMAALEGVRFDAIAISAAEPDPEAVPGQGSVSPWSVEHLVDAWRPGMP